jgi:uncharacterized membrane protein
MCKLYVGMLISVLAFTGCNSKSETGGGAGSDTFKLVVPAMSTDVKQGEVQTVRIKLDRGDGFKREVRLELEAPDGIKVDPNDSTVKPGDKGDVQVKITANEDAPLGEHKIMVKGTPDKGESTEMEFSITVSAK